jgi:hypothetical protein
MKITTSSSKTQKIEYTVTLRVSHKQHTFDVVAELVQLQDQAVALENFAVYLFKKDRLTGYEHVVWSNENNRNTTILEHYICGYCLDRVKSGPHIGEWDRAVFLQIANRLASAIKLKTGLDITTNTLVWNHGS